MPEVISIEDFLQESWDDYKSPTTSNFISKMGNCRNTVGAMEETLDSDRTGLTKMKKSVKALYSSGSMNVSNESYLAENLERLGNNALNKEHESEIGAAFLKFAVVTKELSALMRNLMQNLNNIVMFPLDSFLKGDLRGVKGDLKKPFDKAWKDYENKFNKIEKEKKQLAKEAGMIKTEVTGPEVADDLEKERRMFQLQMCEYLIKVNEIKTKKGVDLLQHLVEFYQAQNNFFHDGLKTIDHFRCYIEELVNQLAKIKQRQDLERRDLVELREALKTSMTDYKEHQIPKFTPPTNQAPSGYSLHQLQGNKDHGCEKSGFLLKKSDGKMRKVWQRRRCIIKDGLLSISHSDTSKEPVKLNLLTCQVKLVSDDPGKKCFHLVSSSKNRTYHFQADDKTDMEVWISVLNNAKEAVLLKAFGESAGPASSPINQSVKELTTTIIYEVRRLPGNMVCCDCNKPEPEWLSVNLGVLICLECCGVHREMGVHISRTQSIVIDDLGTAQLLLARVVSNKGFNDIMEATLDTKLKPTHSSKMEERKKFIRAKYEKKRFAIVTCTDPDDRRQDLKQAVLSRDIFALLQVWAEGVDFMEPLPEMDKNETALHLAILKEDGGSLPMVDFITQNSNSQSLGRPDLEGDTVLHLCAKQNKTEVMKLLLRVQPDLVNYENETGLTALEICKDSNFDLCVELINHAIAGKSELFENVNIDWDLIQDEHLYDVYDYSDDDLDGSSTPDRKNRSRPGSLILQPTSDPMPGLSTRERSHTAESLKAVSLYPPPPPTNGKQGKAPSSATLLSGTSGMTSGTSSMTVSAYGTLQKKKAPAPPPPSYKTLGHVRTQSDQGLLTPGRQGHTRTPSDPPPLPAKMSSSIVKPNALPGAKLVLPPPPPEFTAGDKNIQVSNKRSSKEGVPNEFMDHVYTGFAQNKNPDEPGDIVVEHSRSHSLPDDSRINGAARSSGSSERLGSTDSSSGEILLDDRPVPTPRQRRRSKSKSYPRCRALYDCDADNEDELSFKEGEIILLIKEEEEEWWEGEIEGQPHRRGMFPAPFIQVIRE